MNPPPIHQSINQPSSPMRTGKIARLPNSIRHQLNLRLQDNQPAKSILLWLNNLPQFQSILKSHFDSRPVSKQNLSEWCHGGFRDWQVRQDALELFNSLETKSPGQDPLPELTADKLQRWLVLQYAAAAKSLSAISDDPDASWRRLRQFCADISRLRRAELFAQRLDLEHEWLALDKSNSEARKEKQFWQWTRRPEIRQKLAPKDPDNRALSSLTSYLEYRDLLSKLVRASGDRITEPVVAEPSSPPSPPEEDTRTVAEPTPAPSHEELPGDIQPDDPATQPSSPAAPTGITALNKQHFPCNHSPVIL